jgi:hypothetical protein
MGIDVDVIKRNVLNLVPQETRASVRFSNVKRRRFSFRVTVENADAVELNALCEKLAPCVVFLRAPSAVEASVSSRLDIYIPLGLSFHLFIIYKILYTFAVASATLAVYILIKRQ